jgi:hypothetical protein
MKTPMQEHIEWMQEKLRILVEYKDLSAGAEVDECIQHAEAMLEKEKEAIMNAYDIGWSNGNKGQDLNDLYYFETFNTK